VSVNVAPQVTFDEAIDPLTVVGNVVLRLTATSVVVPASYGFSADYRTVTLTPAAPLAAGTQYTIAVTNFAVRDIAGNFIANTGVANFVTQ
jgi:Big-like domain-containing protein